MLSLKQKELGDKIESTHNNDRRKQLKNERNKILKEIKNLLKTKVTAIIDQELKGIRKYEEGHNKYYHVIDRVNARKPKKPLMIYDKNFNLITSEKDQVNIISKIFQKLSSSKETQLSISPEKTDLPFVLDEIQKTSGGKLINNKANGQDAVHT